MIRNPHPARRGGAAFIGRIPTLSLVYTGPSVWCPRNSHLRSAFMANTVPPGCGFPPTAQQLDAFVYLS